jgi:hypothetical protein
MKEFSLPSSPRADRRPSVQLEQISRECRACLFTEISKSGQGQHFKCITSEVRLSPEPDLLVTFNKDTAWFPFQGLLIPSDSQKNTLKNSPSCTVKTIVIRKSVYTLQTQKISSDKLIFRSYLRNTSNGLSTRTFKYFRSSSCWRNFTATVNIREGWIFLSLGQHGA